MKKTIRNVSILAVLLMVSISILSACSTSTVTSTTVSTTTSTTTQAKNQVDIAYNPGDGDAYLTDGNGISLYYNTTDTEGVSNISGSTLTNWPIFYVASISTVMPTLDMSKFSTITRTDGSKQTAYNGHALYYYAADKNPGDLKGDDVGGVWHLAELIDVSAAWD